MLVKLTDACNMGCSHCLDDCKADGNYMTQETFDNVIKFIEKIGIKIALLSGGEPTMHSKFIDFVKQLRDADIKVLVLSNGLWYEENRTCLCQWRDDLLGLDVYWQITNDDRYYPKKVTAFEGKNIAFVDKVSGYLVPLGRSAGITATEKQSPNCFNLRSFNMHFGDIKKAIHTLRSEMHKMCTPAINWDGSISAGESKFCHKIGNVTDDFTELSVNLKYMDCHNCGLFDKLPDEYKEVVTVRRTSLII